MPEVTRFIKKCNDFGAGGVAVAVGELADGLYIDLDKVPLKYPGLKRLGNSLIRVPGENGSGNF